MNLLWQLPNNGCCLQSHPLKQWVPEAFLAGVKLTTLLFVLPRSRMVVLIHGVVLN
jgi:hypothetical protein